MSLQQEIETVLCSAGAMFDGGSDVSRAEIAEEWAGVCETAQQVERWVAAGCWDSGAAAQLADAGFSPGRNALEYRPGFEREDMDAMYALCNGDTSIAKLSW